MNRYEKGGMVDSFGFYNRFNFKKSADDLTIKISKPYVNRPDRIANDIYGQPNLAWFVMQYNDILDIDELILDKNITLPSPNKLNFGII
jgi:hypothetical protein